MPQIGPLDAGTVDTIIDANRSLTPPGTAEMRSAPRLSISEMNGMDLDALATRLRNQRAYDDRGVVTRVLDLIDLPRNVIFNTATSILDPGVRQRAIDAGERGAFGLPRVNGSDVLRSMGVNNRLINGVAGFGLDVALDPLTYVGPAGWGLKVTGNAGRSITVGRRGAKALRRGIDSMTRGQAVANPEVRDLLQAALARAGTAGRTAKTPEETAAILREFTLGIKPPESLIGQAGRAVGEFIGMDSAFRSTPDSILGRHLDDAAWMSIDPTLSAADKAAAHAARNFYRRYGKAADGAFHEVGVRFGRGGSQVLHIPFTDIGLGVNAFTREGKHAETLQQIARAGELSSIPPGLAAAATSIRTGINTVSDLTREVEDASKVLTNLDPSSPTYADTAQRLAEAHASAREAVEAVKDRIVDIDPGEIVTSDSIAEFLYQAKLVDMARTEMDQVELAARAARPQNSKAMRMIRQEVDDRLAALKKNVEGGDLSGLPDIPQVPVVLKQWEEDLSAAMPGVLDFDPSLAPDLRKARGSRFTVAEESARQMGRDDLAIRAFALDQREKMAANLRAGVNAGLGDEAIDDYYGRLVGFTEHKQGDVFSLYDWQAEIVDASENVTVRLTEKYNPNAAPVEFTVPKGTPIPGLEATHSRQGLKQELAKAIKNGSIPQALMDRTMRHARNMEAAKAHEAYQGWIAMTDEAFEGNTAVADLLQERAELLGRYASHLQAPIHEVATARGEEGLVNLGKFLLGVDDAMVAVSPLGSIGRALEKHKRFEGAGEMALDFDRRARKLVGYRAGAMHEFTRRVKRAAGDDAMRGNTRRAATHIATDLLAALKAAEIPEDRIKDAARWLLARMVVLKQGTHAYFPTALARIDGVLTEVPHQAVEALQEVASLGNPKFSAALDTLARRHIEVLDRIGQESISTGILEHTLQGNIPNKFHGDARDIARRAKRSKDLEGTAQTIGPTGERTTTQYRFRGDDGGLRRVFDYELDLYRNYPEDKFKTLNPAQQEVVREVQESIAQWDALRKREGISEAEMMLKYGKDTDPFELNDLTEAGAMFSIAEGGRPFIEDAVMVLSRRYAEHHRDVAKAEFHELMIRWGVDARTAQIERMSPGGEITLDSGMTARVVNRKDRAGQDKLGVLMNGTFYRTLDQSVIEQSAFDVLNKGADPDLLTRLYPAEVADAIEGVHAIFASPQYTNDLLMAADSMTSLWKTTTLMHPSWVVTNIVGSLALLMQAGANIPQVLQNMPAAIRTVFSRSPDKVADLKIGSFSALDMIRHLNDNYVTAGFLRGTAPDEILAGGKSIFASDVVGPQGFRQSVRQPKAAAAKIRQRIQEQLDERRIAMGIKEGKDLPFKAKVVASTVLTPASRAWFRTNQRIEDAFRLSAMAAWMDQGLDAQQAALQVRTALFDFADFTATENNVRRYLLPFAAWMKNNLAFQMKQLVYRPSQAAMVPKLVDAMEELSAGEAKVPIHQRPRWLSNQIAVQMGADPDSRWSIGIADMVPAADLAANWLPALTGIEGAQHVGNRVLSGLNPVLRAPAELAAGVEFFTGRTIAPDATRGDLSATEFAASQIRPFREFGVLSNRQGPIPRAAEQGPVALAGRAILGGRAQDFSAERLARQKLREYQERETQLRQAIYRNHSAETDTLGPRAELMALYVRMLRDGYTSDVPKWAQEQIAVLVGP